MLCALRLLRQAVVLACSVQSERTHLHSVQEVRRREHEYLETQPIEERPDRLTFRMRLYRKHVFPARKRNSQDACNIRFDRFAQGFGGFARIPVRELASSQIHRHATAFRARSFQYQVRALDKFGDNSGQDTLHRLTYDNEFQTPGFALES
jgi:hypothetical protein